MEGLGGRREAEALVLDVELSVVLADEHVAEDPQRAVGRGDVQPHEARQAHRLAELRHLHHTHSIYRRTLNELHLQCI